MSASYYLTAMLLHDDNRCDLQRVRIWLVTSSQIPYQSSYSMQEQNYKTKTTFGLVYRLRAVHVQLKLVCIYRLNCWRENCMQKWFSSAFQKKRHQYWWKSERRLHCNSVSCTEYLWPFQRISGSCHFLIHRILPQPAAPCLLSSPSLMKLPWTRYY